MKKGKFKSEALSSNLKDFGSSPSESVKVILGDLEHDLHALALKGSPDGANNDPAPDAVGPCRTESQILDLARASKNAVEEALEQEKIQLMLEKELLEKTEEFTLSKENQNNQLEQRKFVARHKAKRGKLKKRKWPVMQKGSTDSFDMKKTKLEDLCRSLTEKKKAYDTNYANDISDGKHLHVKQWFNINWLFGIFVGLLMVLEMLSNFSALANAQVGSYHYLSLVFAVVFAGGQLLSALHMGSAIQNRNWVMIAVHALVFFFCSILLGSFRWQMESETLVKLAFASLNFFIGLAISWAAFKRAQHHKFYLNLKRRNYTTLRIETLKRELVELQEDEKLQLKTANYQVQMTTEQTHLNQAKSKASHLKQIDSVLGQLAGRKQQAFKEIDSIYARHISQYRFLNKQARRLSGFETVAIWKYKDQVGNTKTPSIAPISKIVSFFIMLCGMGLTACHDKHEETPLNDSLHIELLYDVTGEKDLVDHQMIVDYLMTEMKLEEGSNYWRETYINLSQITDRNIVMTKNLTLNKSGNFWLRNNDEHSKAIESFKKALFAEIEIVTQTKGELPKSLINQNIQVRLGEIVRNSGKKRVYIFSDLMQNASDVNFYDYKEQSGFFFNSTDSIITLMERNIGKHDLKGVHIINHHYPAKEMDQIYNSAKYVFQTMWKKQGATVEFKL